MKRPGLFAAMMVVVIAGAAAIRLVSLDNRPMHCDEANHAIKFGKLLECDDYVYNPHEYHGPSLNFLTLPIAYLSSARKLTEITEIHLRLLPAIFGILLVGLVWLLRDELGRGAAFCAAVLTAVSPAMVFFSRYYIHEMLLVCFTFGAMVALWRFGQEVAALSTDNTSPTRRAWLRQGLWLVLFGLCVGMMHASKETCVIPLFAMLLAAVLTVGSLRRMGVKRIVVSSVIALLTAASISALFFSSFLDNPRGIVDSVTTYFHYLGRSSGEGSVGRHDKPWHYYFQMLFWWQRGSGPLWTEMSIAVLALVGLIAAAAGKLIKPAHLPMARFLGIYAVVMTVVYSAVPYKTPWCALGLLHGMILLAGVGATVLIRAAPGHVPKAVVIALLVAASGHLACQAYQASFVAYEDPNNPYVYVHTTGDVPLLAERVRQIAATWPDGKAMCIIQVICPNRDHWPLPWYLRDFWPLPWHLRDLRRVGYFAKVPDGRVAPLIITQPEMERALQKRLAELFETMPPGQRYLYQSLPPDGDKQDWQLRPGVPLRVWVRSDLWEAYRAEGQGAGG